MGGGNGKKRKRLIIIVRGGWVAQLQKGLPAKKALNQKKPPAKRPRQQSNPFGLVKTKCIWFGFLINGQFFQALGCSSCAEL